MILWDFPSSCLHLFMHATALLNSASPSHPDLYRMVLCCFRWALKPSATEIRISELYQLSGSTDSPTAYMILCVRFVCFVRRKFHRLRHRRNTRYGWLARPYPTRTFTLQDAPSFAWRANAVIRGDFTVSCFAHKIERSPCAKRLTVKLSAPLPC